MSGRVCMMIQLIKLNGMHDNNQTEEIVDFALQGIKNANKNVRNDSYLLISEIYNQKGDETLEYLSDVRPAQMEIIKQTLRNTTSNPDALIFKTEVSNLSKINKTKNPRKNSPLNVKTDDTKSKNKRDKSAPKVSQKNE